MLIRVGEVQRLVVDVTAGNEFDFSPPRKLFDGFYQGGNQVTYYEVDLDGNFLFMTSPEYEMHPVTELNVVLNWFEELKERVPAGR